MLTQVIFGFAMLAVFGMFGFFLWDTRRKTQESKQRMAHANSIPGNADRNEVRIRATVAEATSARPTAADTAQESDFELRKKALSETPAYGPYNGPFGEGSRDRRKDDVEKPS